MPDCFISYSNIDEQLARFIRGELQRHGLDVFLASASLLPGEKWSELVRQNLTGSDWIIFLASKAACESPWVQQELGMAIGASKRLVPIVWDIDPSALPGWVAQTHALNVRGATFEQLRSQMSLIAQRVKTEKQRGWLILGAVVAGLFVFGSSD